MTASERRMGRRQLVTVALAGVIALLVVWITWDRITADRERVIAVDNAAQIAEQVRAACARRGATAHELGDLCQRAEAVVIEPGEPIPGPRGEPGRDGRDGRPGRDGVDGRDGADGADGSDGAQGPPGPEGAAGPAGPAGPPGADGTDGADGSDGQPPTSWAFDVCGPLGQQACVTYVCERDDDFDASRPTYTCRPENEGDQDEQ